jgi:hypothetical protein
LNQNTAASSRTARIAVSSGKDLEGAIALAIVIVIFRRAILPAVLGVLAVVALAAVGAGAVALVHLVHL